MLMQRTVSATHTRPVAGVPVPTLHAMFGSIALIGAPMPFERNAEIYGEDEPADYVYQVLTGSVWTYKVLNDGRRQVTAFYLPGDVFGLEFGEAHSCSAEAVVRSTVLIVKRSTVLAAAERNSEVAHRLWVTTAGELKRSQDHTLLLIKSAQERVAAFLLDMADRLRAEGMVELPMSRQDIADYLGLTIETISRTLTQLEDDATIELAASLGVAPAQWLTR
jgi:CRP/FNR family transcriptional regulator, nitrogen fixation regulation protein